MAIANSCVEESVTSVLSVVDSYPFLCRYGMGGKVKVFGHPLLSVRRIMMVGWLVGLFVRKCNTMVVFFKMRVLYCTVLYILSEKSNQTVEN